MKTINEYVEWVGQQNTNGYEVFFHLKDDVSGKRYIERHGKLNILANEDVVRHLKKFPEVGNTKCYEVRLYSEMGEIHFDFDFGLYMKRKDGAFGSFRGFNKIASLPPFSQLVSGTITYNENYK